ncbi:MAG TPA: gamma carbonic anhydrase family protein [Planctomycetota bacterium]|nr:gamma carbonic anhydrase family protein [Planctomycetota bacterium]
MPRLIERGGAFIADSAQVMGDVRLGSGCSVWYGAVLRGDLASITIGESTNVQDLCVLHCDPGLDLVIGKNVTIGHHAMIHCREIGNTSLIGIGAILLAGAKIGEGCIVAAGAVVRERQEIPPRSIVVGVPGKVIGKVDEASIREGLDRAARYLELARRHAAQPFPGV